MFFVEGGHPLHGSVRVDGSKNACLPIMAASLAIDGNVVLQQVPRLRDMATMRQLLLSIGAVVDFRSDGAMVIDAHEVRSSRAPYELVRQMRASVCVLGPLLARFGTAWVSLPGGCNIGHRPIDLHLRGLAALGADIRLEGGYIVAEAEQLRGADVDLCGPHGPTVTGTCNVMMAAALAKGHTIIRSAALEPEVQDFARFLNRAGARISGVGTSTVEIDGVEELQNVCHTVIPDRIEAATLAFAAAITRGDVMIQNAPTRDMTCVLNALIGIGVSVDIVDDTLHVRGSDALSPASLTAEPYPGLPTDCQAQFIALLSTIPGFSQITDRVFPERFMHAAELVRMGADIQIHGNTALINGVGSLSAAPVMASDLRASAALVLGALAAEGRSEVHRVYHLDRGYHAFESKLNQLGARIQRVNDDPKKVIPRPHAATRSSDVPRVRMQPTGEQTQFVAANADPE